MRVYKKISCSLGVCIALSSLASAQTIDTSPIERTPPIIPKWATLSGQCKVTFDVNIEGKPFNIRITACTDTLFEKPSHEAIEKWLYTPKTVDGRPIMRPDVKTKITFKLSTRKGVLLPEAEAVHEDAKNRAKLRTKIPPAIKRLSQKPSIASCCAAYDISQTGTTFNVDIQSCTNEALTSGAEKFLRHLRYKPVKHKGEPVSTGGYKMVIRYVELNQLGTGTETWPIPIIGDASDFDQHCQLIS